MYKLAEYATDDETIEELAQKMNDLERQKRQAEMLLFDMDETSEQEEELEKEIQRFEQWVQNVRDLANPDYQPSYQELRLAIRILGIKVTVYPSDGDYPFRYNIDVTIPEVMKKLEVVSRPSHICVLKC